MHRYQHGCYHTFLLCVCCLITSSLGYSPQQSPRIRPYCKQEGGGKGTEGVSAKKGGWGLDRRESLGLTAAVAYSIWGINLLKSMHDDDVLDEKKRRELFGSLQNAEIHRVLEIGIGGAPNLKYYPPGIEVVGIDPNIDPKSMEDAYTRARQGNIKLNIQSSSAEALPFADRSFDAVVSSLTFCTIPDPNKAIEEVHRVLKPKGKFIFMEHVKAEDYSLLAYEQEALDPLQQLFAHGCHLTRHTDLAFSSSPLFSDVEKWEYVIEKSKWLVSRQIFGVLVK